MAKTATELVVLFCVIAELLCQADSAPAGAVVSDPKLPAKDNQMQVEPAAPAKERIAKMGPKTDGLFTLIDFGLVRTALKLVAPLCNDAARLWIRVAFHDGATRDVTAGTGGIDGSIQYELDRPENAGMTPAIALFKTFVKPGISLGDVVALAAAVGIESCLGPSLSVSPGRYAADGPNANGLIPSPLDTVDQTIANFARMGFTPREAVALIGGGHTIAKAHVANFPPGIITKDQNLDNSPFLFDGAYFKELLTVPAVGFKFPSDVALLNHPTTKAACYEFRDNQFAFFTAFSSAMTKFLKL